MTAGPPPREAWQAAGAGQNTRAQRVGAAIVLLLLAAIAIVVFIIAMRGKSVAGPFVQSMYVPDYDQLVPHSPYVQQDIQRIRELFVLPDNSGGDNKSYNEYAITSGAPLTDKDLQGERLRNFEACQSKDIAIFFIAANGVVDDEGRPGLQSSDGKVNFLEELLAEIQAISASTKLVFLDAGQIGEDYLDGKPVNPFPFALHQLLKAKVDDKSSYDDSLWVINSHGLFQSSIVSYTRRGSVFGVSIFDALAEFRVNGDQNEPIKLGQLYQAICSRCAAMTMDGDRPAQIPLLLRGGHGIVFYSDLDVRDQAMARNIIYPRQMAPVPSADPVAGESAAEADAGEKVDSTAVADKSANEQESADKNGTAELPPRTDENPLERIWNLRDQLQNRQLGQGYSPIDFAPHIWMRINDQIVLFDQRQRYGGDPDSRKLEKIENDLRLLAGLMKANEASSGDVDVSARLVAEWNQFVTGVRPGTSMNRDIAECRDIYFRSRYFLDWTRIPVFRDSRELQEEFLALIAELKPIRPLITNSSIQSTDIQSLGMSVAKLRIHEKRMLKLVGSMVTQLNKSGSNHSANEVYRNEQVLNALLDSPLLSYARPFGFVDTESEEEWSHSLSRKSLNESFADLLAKDLQPLPTENTPFQWATDLWIAPDQKNIYDSQSKMKIVRAFMELGGDSTRFAAKIDCQFPDRKPLSLEQWDAGVANCLKTLADAGQEIAMAQSAIARSIENPKSETLQAWPLAIVLDRRTVHTMAQPRDTLFVAFPPKIEKIIEPIVVEFDFGPGKTQSTKIDLDQPGTNRQIFFSTTGGDPKNIDLKLSIDEADMEYRNLLEFVAGESGVIELDKPFSFPLVRGTNGELLPFDLTIRSAPTNALQSRRQIGIKLGLAGSDDSRVTFADNEPLPLEVLLPQEDRVDLVVGNSSFPTHTVSAVTSVDSHSFYDRERSLLAFANQFRGFDFQLENKSGRTRQFRLELFSVVRPESFDKTDVLPGQVVARIVQDPVALARQLEALKRATLANAPLATSKQLELAPGGSDILDFRPAPREPETTSDPPGNGPSGQIAPETETQFDFNNGIYCRLSETDVDHGRQATRDFWFDIKPLPSEQLVSASATFDPVAGLFSVRLEPALGWNDGKPCPVPGGVVCELEIGNSGDFSKYLVRNPETLNDENRQGELQFKIDQKEMASRGPVLLYVNVNGYRGVFIYRLSETDFQTPASRKVNLRPDNHFLVLRQIVTQSADEKPVRHWRTGKVWSFKPPENVVFEILADIDDATSDSCQIQLDIKREEWNTPKTESRLTDRHVDYRAKINEESGFLDLQAVVKDHEFRWSPTEVASGICELTSRVIDPENRINPVPGETTFFEKLLIDGTPPVTDEARWVIDDVKKGQFASITEKQQHVRLELVTADLTGTKSVRLFVDKDNDPVVSDADTELDPAEPNGANENWRFFLDIETLLKAKTLSYGDNEIYALLVDQLGNETERNKPFGPLTLTIRKLTEQEIAMLEEAKIKKYILNIQLLRRDATPVPKSLPPDIRAKILDSDGKEVQFRSKANQDGSYSVFDVPVGDYKLVCEYTHTTPTHVKKKLRKEMALQLTIQKAPDTVVMILEEVEDDE